MIFQAREDITINALYFRMEIKVTKNMGKVATIILRCPECNNCISIHGRFSQLVKADLFGKLVGDCLPCAEFTALAKELFKINRRKILHLVNIERKARTQCKRRIPKTKGSSMN